LKFSKIFKKLKVAANVMKREENLIFEIFEKKIDFRIFKKFWFCALFGRFPTFFDFSKIFEKWKI
jgi:hypothetical protein